MTIRDDDFATVRYHMPRGGNAWAESNDALDRIEEAFTELRAQAQGGGKHEAWELGYAQGYSDREKTDHDRADVEKSPNPYPIVSEAT